MIPYKSSNEMILSVMQGQTLFAISDGPPAIPQIKAGKVKALAVTDSVRSEEVPDVPSMAEAGFPDVNIKLFSGYFAAVGTPPAIVAKLEDGAAKGHQGSGCELETEGHGGDAGRSAVGRIPRDDRPRTSRPFPT